MYDKGSGHGRGISMTPALVLGVILAIGSMALIGVSCWSYPRLHRSVQFEVGYLPRQWQALQGPLSVSRPSVVVDDYRLESEVRFHKMTVHFDDGDNEIDLDGWYVNVGVDVEAEALVFHWPGETPRVTLTDQQIRTALPWIDDELLPCLALPGSDQHLGSSPSRLWRWAVDMCGWSLDALLPASS